MKVLMIIISNNENQPPYDPVYGALKSVWRKYMNIHPSIECLFLEHHDEKDKVIEDNTFYVKGQNTFHPGIRDKTIDCFEYFVNQETQYDFIVRTNLSSLWNFGALIRYLETLPRQDIYSGIFGYHEGKHFISGAGFIITPDVVKKLLHNRELMNHVNVIDDVDIGYALYRIGVPFKPGTRQDFSSTYDFLRYKHNNDIYHYRIKMAYENRNNEPFIMEKLLEKIYDI
jgi:hypothetical protein